MSRNARTSAPRRRAIALSFGTAAGAALIAASFSLGTAPVASADPVSDLVGAVDVNALPAAGVSDTLALSYLIEAIDPEAFSSTGAPTDPLGELGYFTDTYFLGPTGLDAELAPLVQELVGTITVGAPGTYTPEISELIFALDPDAFTSATSLTPTDEFGELGYYTDTYLFGPLGIDNLIAPYIQEIIASLPASAASVDVSPASDLVIDGLLNSGLSLF
jgi:hypothetical protein